MNLIELNRRFPSQRSCLSHLESIRWGEHPTCVYCNSSAKVSKRKDVLRYHCNNCNKSFSVLVGTIFEGTKIPMIKWFTAICLISNARKGISARQLARDIEVNKDTAWYMQMRIRAAMKDDNISFFEGIIEVDETYVGGSMRNKTKKERATKYKNVITGMNHKIPLLGIYNRGGRIVVKSISKATGEHIRPVLKKFLKNTVELVTDGFGGYYGLDKVYKKHVILYHSKDQHRKGVYHTNTIEGFWSMLKRSIIGQYHNVSNEYIQNYVDELSFKYNNRKIDIFNCLLISAVNNNMSFNGT